jgi:acetyltransferase-like isoleucine patch superfamily enzyme
MGKTQHLLQSLVAFLKSDPNYRMATEYSARQVFSVMRYRAYQALRGLRFRFMFAKAAGIVFCGRRVVIEHSYQIRSGPSLILEDNVHINALSANGFQFGRNVTVGRGSSIISTGVIARIGVGLTVGDYSAIGAFSYFGAQGGINIGSSVIMGPGVRIFSENHVYSDIQVPIRKQGETRKGVIIEDDCWIGASVTIVDGVVIGTGTVVAAGSVVTKSCPPYSVLAGVPARVIKSRSSQNNNKEGT